MDANGSAARYSPYDVFMAGHDALSNADRCELDAVAVLCRGGESRADFLGTLVGRLCRYIGADGYCFSLLDPATGLPAEVFSPFDDAARNGWLDAVFRRSPLGDMGWLSRQPQRVQWAEQFVARPASDPLTQNMLLPFGMEPMVGLSLSSAGRGWGYLNFMRQTGSADFGAGEKRFLAAVVPILLAALRRRAALQLLSALPGSDVGLITIDPGGEVDAMNELGATLMRNHAGSTFPLAVAVMGQLLRRSIREGAPAPAGHIAIVSANHQRYWVRPQLLATGDGRRRGVVIAEPLRALNDAATLMQLGLTRRECDVATTTMRGLSTQDAAAVLGMSPHTVEHHLSNLFMKLGVGSRAEMTALLLGGWEAKGVGNSLR